MSPDFVVTIVKIFQHIKNWRTQNQMTPAELWIDLFVFFSMSFDSSENVVSIKKVMLKPISNQAGLIMILPSLEWTSHQRGKKLEVQEAGN